MCRSTAEKSSASEISSRVPAARMDARSAALALELSELFDPKAIPVERATVYGYSDLQTWYYVNNSGFDMVFTGGYLR